MKNVIYKEDEQDSNINAKMIADSIINNTRIVTMELSYPEYLVAELNTHRVKSRSTASSRAIPTKKKIDKILNGQFFTPSIWGVNQRGMQGGEEIDNLVILPRNKSKFDKLSKFSKTAAYKIYGTSREKAWKEAAESAASFANAFDDADYHKQIPNRLMAPFSYTKTIITATSWDNFFELRVHEAAEPHIHKLAKCMKEVFDDTSIQKTLNRDQWHLPYITEEELYSGRFTIDELLAMSSARCARVSYNNHNNQSPTFLEDFKLYKMLKDSKHLSPFEHQATTFQLKFSQLVKGKDFLCGNFALGIVQHRKLIEINGLHTI